jgi:filamentous hemagglutinin
MVSRRHTSACTVSLSRRALSAAVLSALLGTPVFAQVTPDPNAGAHRPGTDTAANGVPLVNITAPNSAGVSHNQYQQFNVDTNGLILNNAATVSQTQLAGYIVGNPNYQPGQSAKVIINEVTSTNPTYLRGYMEVAGNAADLVIANPNGISVDGGGFINTPRATLTTGIPVFGGDGSLSAFHVTGGSVSIEGAGLNTSNIDRLDLIARSLSVSGNVWANNLNVVTGANQIDYAGLSAQAMAGDGDAPSISLDVAALGGMYANKIMLVGTEAGIGVRNTGTLASQSSDFTINSAGQLQLTGTTSSAGNLTINGSALSNSGTLQSSGVMSVQTSGVTSNTGTLISGSDLAITTGSLTNSGALQSSGSTTLQSTGDVTNAGTLYSGGDLTLSTNGVLSNGAVVAAANNATLRAQQLMSTGTLGASVTSDGSVQGNGALTVTTSGMLTATGVNLAGGGVALQGNALDLSGAQTQSTGNIALIATSGDINHQNGTLATSGVLDINAAGTVDNRNATLQAGQLTAQAGAWRNAYGSVMQTGSALMNVQIGGMLDNTHGVWAANAQNMSLQSGALDNTGGAMEQAGTGTLAITTGTLTNNQGQILGNGNLLLNSGNTTNHGGLLSVAGNATLNGTNFDNTGGTLVANALQAQWAGAFANAGGLLQANSARIVVNTLNNSSGQLKALNGSLAINAQALNSDADGFIGSNQDVSIQAGTLTNAGQMYAGTDLAVATQGDTTNSGALQAQGNFNAGIGGTLNNNGGALGAGSGAGNASLTINAASLSNQNGRIANADSGATSVTSGGIDNTGGTLGGQGDVTLNASQLINAQGTLVAGGNFALQSGYLANANGVLYSAGTFDWNNGIATLDNTNGSIGAGGAIDLTLGTVHNNGGDIVSNSDVTSQFNALDGVGRVRAGHDLMLTINGNYTNQAGNTLFANNNFTFNVAGAFVNASGATLQSVNALTLNAANVDNQASADINSAATTVNAATQTNEGRIEGDTVTLNAGDVTNTGTIIGNAITLNATNLTNGADLGTDISNTNNPYQTALIAAVGDINLYITGSVLNRDAMLYSAFGNLTIAADATGTRNNAVLNLSGDIEAGGDIFIATNQFIDQRRVFETSVYNLTAAEQAQNTYTYTLARYLWNGGPGNNESIASPPDADPSQIIDPSEFAIAKAFCDNLNASTDNQRCAGYPFGVGSPNTFQGVYTSTLTAITQIAATSAESRLLAGGNITLNGSVLNDKSTIAAGNNLIINGQDGNAGGGNVGTDTVQNIAWVPTGTVVTTINEQSATQQLISNPRGWIDGPWMTYGTQTLSDTMPLGAGQVPSWITLAIGPGANATMSAGNAVDISAQTISNTQVGADGQPVSGVGLGANQGGVSLTGQPATGAQVIGTPQQPFPVQLPSNGLYSIHPGSGSPYLVETDPRFASYVGFLGSDYLLDRLGLDGDATLKRLGDAFFETQLVMDQITSLTGLRFIDGATDALDQYEALMDAGVEEAQQFNLTVGVALTPAQMANLTQDMVWLVNETVDGEQVLVPVVYLSQKTADSLASGAVIQGNTVSLNANGPLTNTGTINATSDASIQAGTLLNAGNLSAGGSLSVAAAQDLLNVGSIQGGNVTLVAGNDLTSRATTGNVSLGGVNLSGLNAPGLGTPTGGQLTATGTLIAQAGDNLTLDHATVSAGQNLGLAAGYDLTATASTLTTGGDAQLIAGRDIHLNAGVTTQRQGTQMNGAASTTYNVTSVQAGGNLALVAGNDLTSQGAQLNAGDQLALAAGHDVVLNAVTDSTSHTTQSVSGHTITSTGQYDETLRGTTLTGANGVAISAGNDLSMTAGVVSSANGDVALAAGHDVNLIAGQETHSQSTDTVTTTGGLLSSSRTTTHDAVSDTYAVGTQLGGSNVSVAAGNDLTAQAVYINADNALTLAAGHDVNLTDAQDIHSEQHDYEHSSFNFFSDSSKRFGSVDPEWRSNSTSTTINQSSSVGSVLSGDSVTIAAGNNLTATNAQVVATNDVILAAGNNLTLNAGQNTYDYRQSNSTSHTGLMNNGGLSVLIGNRSTDNSTTVHDVSYTGSTVGSLNGSVTLSAGNDVHITGSDVISNMGTTIVGKNVTIDAAVGSTDITQTQKVSQAGINVGIGGAAGQVANTVAYSVQRAGQVQDSRLSALYAAQAAQALFSPGAAGGMGLPAGQNGVDAISNVAKGNIGIDFKIGIGGSSASSTTTSHDDTTYGSLIHSNGNVTIAATGGDLNIIGSQVNGQNVALAAANNINLLSQAENHTLQSSNQNVSAGVGILIGSSGFGIYAEASGSQGKAHGNGVTHTYTTVNADGTLTLISGNDTTIKGAQLTGNQVIANIGNNLLIQSEQDTDDYASKQWQAGGQVVIGYSMPSGGSLSYNQSKVNSHYASVTDVSGIQAGDGGFDITVGGNTHLIGGVIASTADPANNTLNTGSLTFESIHNEANYSARSVGISGGYSTGGGGYGGSGFGGAPSIAVPQGKSSSSDTHSGIAQGTIIQRDGNTDLSGLDRNPTLDNQALTPIFDLQKVQTQLEMGRVAGQVGMTAAGDLASQMGWAEGSPERTILHGVVGAGIAALGGGEVVGGALGAAANQLVVQKMADYLVSQGYTPGSPEFATMLKLASTAVGAAVGGGTGAATALDGTTYNYLTHQQVDALNAKIKQCGSDRVCVERAKSDAEILSAKQEQDLVSACSGSASGYSDACKAAILDAYAYATNPLAAQLGLQTDQAITMQDYLNNRSEWGLVYGDSVRNRFGELMFVPAAAGGGTALAVGATPAVAAWGQEAWAAYQVATQGYSLGAAATSGALGSGAAYTLQNAVGAGLDASRNDISFAQSFDQRFSYLGLTGSMAIGAVGGVFQTQMFQWTGIPNSFSNWITVEGAVIRINKTAVGVAAGKATQGAIQQSQAPSSKQNQ